jgi:hypothetical protein
VYVSMSSDCVFLSPSHLLFVDLILCVIPLVYDDDQYMKRSYDHDVIQFPSWLVVSLQFCVYVYRILGLI